MSNSVSAWSCAEASRGSARCRILAVALMVFMLARPITQAETPAPADPLLFRFPMAGKAQAGPFAAASRLWVISEDGNLYVVMNNGRAVGKRAWTGKPFARIVADPFGRVLVNAGDTTLRLLNPSGDEILRFEAPGPVIRESVFGPDGRCFVASPLMLSSFASNGTALWHIPLESAPRLGPLLVNFSGKPDEERVVVALENGDLSAYARDGAPLFSVRLPGKPSLGAALDSGFLIMLEGGKTQVLDSKGIVVSGFTLPSTSISIRASGQRVFCLGSEGSLSAWSSQGKMLWTRNIQRKKPFALQEFQNRLIVLCPDGASSFSLDGEAFREIVISNAGTVPVLDSSGLVCSAGEDWILYAYRFEQDLKSGTFPELKQLDLEALRTRMRLSFIPLPDFEARDDLDARLNAIEKRLITGSEGENEASDRDFLVTIALSAIQPALSHEGDGASPAIKDPLPRSRACVMLGWMGSPVTADVLARVFSDERDDVVRAAAAYGIAKLGMDPTGSAVRAFEKAVQRYGFLDLQGALAVIDAVEAIYRSGVRIDDPSGVTAIVTLSERPYPSVVRQRAEAALRRLSKR